MMSKTMRFKSAYVPMTPAERQRECRARKRAAAGKVEKILHFGVPALAPPPAPNAALPAPARSSTPALPAPAAAASAVPALPAPPRTAIQKATSGTKLALPELDPSGETIRLSLPAAVAARLKSLIDRHHAGTKPLTAAERAEAEGLIDIAEFFVVQRMRNRLAA